MIPLINSEKMYCRRGGGKNKVLTVDFHVFSIGYNLAVFTGSDVAVVSQSIVVLEPTLQLYEFYHKIKQ